MIVTNLHHQPVPLDVVKHRQLALAVPSRDGNIAGKLNSIFVAANEFPDACRTFPLVFIPAGTGEDGKMEFAPIAVLGLAPEENLFVTNGDWRADYDPMVLRCYPFGIARIEADRYAVCVDMAWGGVRPDGDGERLFNDDGTPTEFTKNIQAQLERFEVDVERTRRGLRKIADLDLMREMRFDGTMPNGESVAINGFYAIDEEKTHALPEDVAMELHRDGLFAVIYAHWFSLGHMSRLLKLRADATSSKATVA